MHVLRRMELIEPEEIGEKGVVRVPKGSNGPVLKGMGDTDLACGRCGRILVEGLGMDLCQLVIGCPACGALNGV